MCGRGGHYWLARWSCRSKAFPGNVHKILNLVHQGDEVVIEWKFNAIHNGEFSGIPPTGRTVNLPGGSVYTVAGRQITRGNLYFHGPTLMEQLKAASYRVQSV